MNEQGVKIANCVKKKKKWSQDEINIILNYMRDNENIEVPTAQIYYKKLIERTGIDASWDLIKWKVRHLKASFTKANDWRKSTGAGLLECDSGVSTVEGKVLQMCPHFEKMSEIFSNKRVNDQFPVEDSGEFQVECEGGLVYNAHTTVIVEEHVTPRDSETITSPPIIAVNSTGTEDVEIVASTPLTKKSKEFAEKLRRHVPKSSASHLAAFHEQRTTMLKMKVDWEKEKYERDSAMEEKKIKLEESRTILEARRLKLEEDKFQAELDMKYKEIALKEKQMEKDEKLAMLALEKEERIKKLELELKYKTGQAG